MSASEPLLRFDLFASRPVRLSDIWPIAAPDIYKLHFARWNGHNQPLEVWARDKAEWQGWQQYRPVRDEFNRQKIFSLIQFYHEPDSWLFGGVFNVEERLHDRYIVALSEEGGALVGRLKIRSSYRERATRVNFENHYPSLEVFEILRQSVRALVDCERRSFSFNPSGPELAISAYVFPPPSSGQKSTSQ
ncbi:hypothetical protein [Bradyrhizobium sp. MOS003]|uniref:hypothetical protein n=1 Tax=Bradyrhizobium sp. MOS003 TaxID=2133946 RepID=UPI001FE23098|nr:hypothetical protein [Bradyrhizobium sp. MOS003]